MMIAALIQGELIADPIQRETAKGVPFATATVRVPAGAEALFFGVAAFDATAAARMAKLHKGACIAAAGTLEATEWKSRDGEARKGWRLTASEVLSVYSARKRREAEAAE